MDVRHFGLLRAGYALGMKTINLLIDLRIIRVFKCETVDPDYLETDQPIEWRCLNEHEIRQLARDGTHTEEFVRTALAKGDECYGGFDGDLLVSHGWYSTRPTDDEGLTFQFGSGYMYQYAASTHRQYRGRRITPVRGNLARREHLRRGYKGTVFTIDSHNFPALHAMSSGAEGVGRFVVLKFGRLAWIRTSRGCREHGFSLERPAEPVALPTASTRKAS